MSFLQDLVSTDNLRGTERGRGWSKIKMSMAMGHAVGIGRTSHKSLNIGVSIYFAISTGSARSLINHQPCLRAILVACRVREMVIKCALKDSLTSPWSTRANKEQGVPDFHSRPGCDVAASAICEPGRDLLLPEDRCRLRLGR